MTLAAWVLGAKEAHGIEIDPEAIVHAQGNVLLNDMQRQVFLLSTQELNLTKSATHVLTVMNMIQSEQEIAWRSLAPFHSVITELITSGILENESDDYLKFWESLGWRLEEKLKEEGWQAFCFTKINLID